ncbi:MAG: LuxR C-terminal-related transcriptional regulator [Eubacteriales bacterium]|nr:LuxR C-terminal-related transcriptional regulator [Lachnospiraceae bacterium]MDO5127601.1 LuxR C-terminal-related transcriptional regulator [Eubacteriales bacterium]
MKKRLRNIVLQFKTEFRDNMTLGQKIRIYMLLVAFVTVLIGVVFLVATGSWNIEKKTIGSHLRYELAATYSQLEDEINLYEGYGLALSRTLGKILDNELYNGIKDISSLDNNADKLLELQEKMFGEINTTLQMAGSSGVFVVLDTTTNSQAPNAENSRSGLYIRLKNVGDDVAFKQTYSFFRGIPDVAHSHDIEMNTRWNLEFNIDNLPYYKEMMESGGNAEVDYYWTERIQLEGTWQNVILLCFPIYSAQGTLYGMCGIELSALYFQNQYPSVDSDFGKVVMVLAPMEDGVLMTSEGMTGGTDGTWLSADDNLKYRKTKPYNIYQSEETAYFGLQKSISINSCQGKDWQVVVLIPKESCQSVIMTGNMKYTVLLIVLLIVMVVLSIILSRRIVRPIQKGVEDIKEKGIINQKTFGIKEFDSLIEYLNDKMENDEIKQKELPNGVEELFDRFVQGVDKLSKAEYRVFQCYLDGYQVAQVPEVAFISMSTVKKHNRSIYEKLGVSSYDELMLYLDMLERCDRRNLVIRNEEDADE